MIFTFINKLYLLLQYRIDILCTTQILVWKLTADLTIILNIQHFFAATSSCPLASQSYGEHFPALLVCLCLPGGPVAIILLTTPGDPGKYQLK